MNKDIIIYQGNNGEIALKGDLKRETVWASQAQIVDLFGVDQSVVSRHVRNIFKDGEIEEKSNMQKMHIPNSDKPVVLLAESRPHDKERVIGLILQLLVK